MKIHSKLFFWFLVSSNFFAFAALAPLAFAVAYPISKHTTLFLPDDRGYAITPLLMSNTTVFRSANGSKNADAVEVWVTRGKSAVIPLNSRVQRDWKAMIKVGSLVDKDSGCRKNKPLVYTCQRTYRDGRIQVGFWNELKDVVNLEITGKDMKSKKMASWSKDVFLAPVRLRKR
jgi:hypothetical protein